MELSRIKELIANKNKGVSSSKSATMPPPPTPKSQGTPATSGTPEKANLGFQTPASTRPEGSSQKGVNLSEEDTSKRAAEEDLASGRPDKRNKVSDIVAELMSGIEIREGDPPTSARTRTKSYTSPPSSLKSPETDVMIRFLNGMANSSDKFAIEPMSPRAKLKAAIHLMPKATIFMAEALMDAYNKTEEAELRKQLQKAQDKATKAQDYANRQAQTVKALKAEVETLKAAKDEVEATLAKEITSQEEDIKMALRSAREKWVKALPHSKEGQVFTQAFKQEFLESEEFTRLVEEKAFGFFNQGFECSVAQFKAAGYPPEGASSSFIDPDAAIMGLAQAKEAAEDSATPAQDLPQDAAPGIEARDEEEQTAMEASPAEKTVPEETS